MGIRKYKTIIKKHKVPKPGLDAYLASCRRIKRLPSLEFINEAYHTSYIRVKI